MLPLGCMGSVVYLYLHGIPENSKPYRHPKSFQDFPCKRKPLKAFFRPRRCELGFMKKPILTERCLDVQGFKYQTGSVDVPHRSSQGVLNVQGCQTFKNLNLLLLTIFPSENWGGGANIHSFRGFLLDLASRLADAYLESSWWVDGGLVLGLGPVIQQEVV